jgi:protoheme ferro-lyase
MLSYHLRVRMLYLLIFIFRNADFLSSIEVLVVDQMDTLAMQNWEHVQVCTLVSILFLQDLAKKKQFVFSHLNKLPKESHNSDFSRIKPWYLDGQYVSPLVCSIRQNLTCDYTKFCISPPIHSPLRVRDTRNASFVQHKSYECRREVKNREEVECCSSSGGNRSGDDPIPALMVLC